MLRTTEFAYFKDDEARAARAVQRPRAPAAADMPTSSSARAPPMLARTLRGRARARRVAQTSEPIKRVPISDVHGVAPAKARSEPRCFEVATPGRPYYMIAENDDEYEGWLSAFATALDLAARAGRAGPPSAAPSAAPHAAPLSPGGGGGGASGRRHVLMSGVLSKQGNRIKVRPGAPLARITSRSTGPGR